MASSDEQAHEARRRTERWLIVAVAGYAALVAVLMFAGGLRITPDVLVVALALVAVILGRTRLFLRDWIPFVVIFLAYELMRGIADDAGFPVHIADVRDLELALFGGILPTAWLQDRMAPPSGVGTMAIVATVLYMLHFALPVATGFLLWVKRRALYHEYLAAFVLLSFAGFVTYLLVPVAPPWLAAEWGYLDGPNGEPIVRYLKPEAFAVIAEFLGYPNGRELSSYVFYGVNPNGVAAFPSLHAGYPFLSFLVLRQAFGRWGYLALAYAAAVWWAIVFTGDHYVVDVLAGVVYATAAYLVAPRLSHWVTWVMRRGRPAVRAEPTA
jgi:PAP2 superfamily